MITVIRYWGSHLKTLRQSEGIARDFAAMADRNWSCHLVMEYLPDDAQWLSPLQALSVRIHVIQRPSRKFDPSCIAGVFRMCRKIRPDVFICENIHDSPLLGSALAGVPVRIWIKRSMNASFETKDHPSIKDRLALTTRLSSLLATRVMAVSGSVRDELLNLGINGSKVLVRPNPMRLGGSPIREPRDTVRKRFGFSNTDIVWISVGHAVPVKGWDMLIRAFRQVADQCAMAKLLLVGGIERPGEAPHAKYLRRLTETLGLSDRVVFAGHVSDVGSLLHASDGFAMPSRSEGFSLALVEALEAGLPCVATRVGIAPDVITPGINGMLIDRNDETGFAQALCELTLNEHLRARFAARATVPDRIPTPERYAERLMDDCLALCQARKNPTALRPVAPEPKP